MNFYLLEDDDKSITLYNLYPQLMHIKYFVLISIYIIPIKFFIASDVVPTLHVCINSKNNSDVCYIYNSNYEILN